MPQVGAFLTTVSKIVTFGKVAGGTAALIIGATTIVGASFAAARLLRPKIDMDIGDGDGSRQRTVRSTIEPQKLVYGETMVSGPLTYAQVSGTNNKYLHQVIALAGHELTQIKEIHFDDKPIDITDSNIYNASNRSVISGFFGPKNDEGGNSETVVLIDTRLGTSSQTAYADLRSDSKTSQEYLATHRGDGIASLYTRWTLNEGSREVWDEVGSVQNIKAVVKGKKVYDPRLDVNAGNTAGTNPTNASYVVYSDNSLSTGSAVGNYDRSNQGQNPALILADYLMDSRFGLGIASSKIDWSSVVAAADHCDQLVPVPSSATQKRFFGSGVIFGGDKHRRSIEKILNAMNGSLVYTSGKYVIRAGVYFSVSETLTENDVIGPVQVQTSIPRSDRFNQVKGLFIDPSENYKMMEFGPVTTGANDFNSQPVGAIARDNGEVLTQEIRLPFTSNRYAAQRLALLQVAQSYHQTVITVPVNLKGMRIAIGDRVNLTIDALNEVDSGSWSPKIFKCIGWSFSESDQGGIDLTLIEDFSASYNNPQESDYSTITAEGVINTSLPDVPSPTNFTATAGINRVELNWTNPPNTGAWEQIWVYASTSSTTPTDSSTPIAKFRGTSFTHMLDGGTNNYYWIQAVRYPNGTTPGSGQTNAAKSAFIPASPTNVTANKITTTVIGNNQVDTLQIANDAIGSDQMDTIQSSNYSASAGSEAGWKIDQDGSAEFNNVVVRGNVNATTGTIGGLTVGSDKLYVGTGTFNNSNTAFYVDDQGQLSLKDKLTWNGSALSVTGTINATGGTFSGTVQVDNYITVGGAASASTIAGLSGVTSSDLRMWAGDTFANSETAPFRVESDGTVIASRLIVTQPSDTTSVIFDSAEDGLVGVGLSSLSQDTGIVVQQPSAVLSSQTATQAVTLSSTQTLTLTVTMELPYPKVASGQILAAAYPSDITATIQYSTDGGSNFSTFATAIVKQRALSNASSDNTKFGVRTFALDGLGGGYVRDLHAIDAAGNLILSASASLGAANYLFRVQLSSTNGTDSRFNPDLTANRTLKFQTDAAGFTVSANGTIVDAPGNTATIGYVSSNFAALESTNTFKMGSGEFNLFEDDSGNDVLNIQQTKTSAFQLLEVVHSDSIPGANQADIIFKVRGGSSSNQDLFTIAKAGVVTWSGGGSANANTAYTYSQVGHLPLAGGTVSGNLTVTGDFTVQGTTTTIDTTTLNVEDKNITLNYSTSDSSASADGAGITIQDAVNASTDATLNWNATNDRWEFSHQAKTPSLMVGSKERIDSDGDLNNIRNLNMAGTLTSAGTATATFGGSITTGNSITVGPQNSSNEGGEIVLQGAGTNENITLDNHSGLFRVFDGSAPEVRLSLDTSGSATFAGSVTAGNSSTAAFLRAHFSDGSYMTLEGFGLVMNRAASYIRPSTDGNKTLYIGGADDSLDWSAIHFRSSNGLFMTGTQFLDTGRNLTNIGTISSGAITSGTINVNPQGDSSSPEGGEIVLLGSGSNEDINIDNYSGTLRIFDASAPQVRLTLNTSGNAVFAGSLTATALNLGDNSTNEIPIAFLSSSTDFALGANGDNFMVTQSTGDLDSNPLLTISSTGNATFAGTVSSGQITSTITSGVGIRTVYGLFAQFATDSQMDLVSSSAGTWGSAINFVEGSNTSNTDVWSIARKTTGGSGDSSLHFNFGTANSHLNTSRVSFSSAGNATFAGSVTGAGLIGDPYLQAKGADGAMAVFVDSKSSFDGSNTLNAPMVIWREADGSNVAGIRGYVDTGGNKLALGTGFFDQEVTITPTGMSVAGTLDAGGTGSFTGGGTTLLLKKSNNAPSLGFGGTDGTATALIEGINGGGLKIYTSTGTLANPAWSPKFTIAANGNTTIAGNLDVEGSITKTGDLELDISGDFIFDADGGDFIYRDGGTNRAQIKVNDDANVDIKALTADHDIRLMGLDGSTPVTALKLDMSQGGEADFAGAVKVGGAIVAHQTNRGVFEYASNTFKIRSYGATSGSGAFTISTGGGGGSADTVALSIDSSQQSTFSGNVAINKSIVSTVSLSVAAPSTSTSAYGLEVTNGSSNTRFLVDGVGNSWFYKTSNSIGMRWDAVNSRLAVGHASPDFTLDVKADQDTWISRIYNTGSDANAQGLLVRSDATSAHDALVFGAYADSGYKMVIRSTGKVLIGDTASHTSDLLQIETPASGGGHGIQIRRNDANNDQQIGRLLFGNNTDTDLAQIAAKTDGDGDSGALFFSTQPTGGSLTERLKIDSAGNILQQGSSPEYHFGTDSASHYNWRIAVQEDVNAGFEIASGTQSAGSGALSDSYTTRFVVKADSGRIGIGTTNPAYLMQLSATDDTDISIISGKDSGDFGSIIFGDTDYPAEGRITYQNFDDAMRFWTNRSQAMMIDSSRNVGIGLGNPSSYYSSKLVVSVPDENGITIVSDPSHQAYLMFADGTSGASRYRGYIGYDHPTDTMQMTSAGESKFIVNGSTEAMRLTTNGELRIGQNTGTVFNQTTVSGITNSAAGYFQMAAPDATVMYVNRIGSSSQGQVIGIYEAGAAVGGISSFSDAIQFGQGNVYLKMANATDTITPANGNGTDNDNELSIGTTTARIKNIVVGSQVRLESGTGGTTDKIVLKTTDNADESKFIRTNAYYVEFGGHANEGFKFIDTNGNTLLAMYGGNNALAKQAVFAGNVTAFSDERLKSNVETLDGSKVLQMRGVSYTRDGKAGSGVIAQELEKHAPELVFTSNDEMQTKSVAYANLTGYLIEAVKMQAKQIAELEKAIKELKDGSNEEQ